MKRSAMPRKAARKRRSPPVTCSVRGCVRRPGTNAPMCIQHLEAKADRLFSLWVRERDEGCTFPWFSDSRYPSCEGPLQAAHGEPRGTHGTRFDPRNAHALCRTHHYLIDSGSKHALKRVWLIDVLGRDVYDSLMDDALHRKPRITAALEALEWLEKAG